MIRRRVRHLGWTVMGITVCAAWLTGAVHPAGAQRCPGDCDSNGEVTVNEIILGVNIALGSADVSACTPMDVDEDGAVGINELIAAVNAALNGCPHSAGTPTFTPTRTVTMLPTDTPPATPTPSSTPTPSLTPTATDTSAPLATPTATPTATTTPTPTPTAGLALAIEMNPAPVLPGELLHMLLTITNPSATLASSVQIDVVLPDQINAFSRFLTSASSCTSGNTCNPGDHIIWNVGDLSPSAGVTVDLPPTIKSGAAAPAPGTVVELNAVGRIGAASSVSTTASVVVATTRTFDLAIDADADPIPPGATLTYTITFGNTTTATVAQNTRLRLPLPASTELVSASDGGTLTNGTVEWTLGTLNPGNSGERELVVHVANTALLGTIIPAEATIDNDGGNNPGSAAATTRVQSAGPLQLAMELNPDPVRSNETMLVSLVVTNAGVIDLPGVQLDMPMPVGINSVNVGLTGGASCPNIIDSAIGCAPPERAAWTVGTLKPGESRTLALPPTVGSVVQGRVITFTANASDGTGNHRTASRTVRVRSGRVFDLAVHEDADPVAAGATLTYTLTFANTDTGTVALNTVLRMPVPAGTTFAAASDGGVLTNGVVEWALGTLTPGQGDERALVVEVADAAAAGSIIAAQAEIEQAAPFDRTRAVTSARVQSGVPLQLALAVNPNPVRSNETTLVTMAVTNTGAVDLPGVQVELLPPVGVSSLSVGLTGGASCPNIIDSGLGCAPPERITWTLGTLKAGAGTTIALPPSVAATLQGSVLSFTALASDQTGNRRTAARALRVRSTRVFDLAVHEDADPVAPTEPSTYTLTFGNATTGTVAESTVLRMPLPVGTELVSASDGGTVTNGVVEWNLGTLNPGQSGERQLVVQVAFAADEGSILTARAEIADATAFDRTAATTQTRVRSDVPLQLAMAVNPNPARTNELLQAALVATNTGSIDLLGVQVELLLPVGLSSTSVGLTGGATCPNIIDSGLGCAPPERVTWALGTIKAGQGRTLALPPAMAATVQGSVVSFTAVASDNGEVRRQLARAVRIRTGRVFDLAVRGDVDPVLPGAVLTYTLTFGNASTGTVAQNAFLRMPLPIGTELVSASGGGMATDGVVEWNLGTLNPGVGGVRQLVVNVANTTPPGSVLEAQAEIDDSATFNRTGAATETRVHGGALLDLSMSITPNTVLPGGGLQISVTAKNTGGIDLPLVQIELLLPAGINSFAVSQASGATCPNIIDSGLGCAPPERVTWALGTLTAGELRTVTAPPVVANSTRKGSVIVFDALASYSDDRRANASGTVLVGP